MRARSSNSSVSAKFCPMLVVTSYSGGVIIPKTYLNHELGSKFFFLRSLAYKLVNLLVFEKILSKMSKNWTFSKTIGLGLNCTYEFEVHSRQSSSDRRILTKSMKKAFFIHIFFSTKIFSSQKRRKWKKSRKYWANKSNRKWRKNRNSKKSSK